MANLNTTYADGPAQPVKMSPFDSLADAVDRYRALQKFAEALADRIAGQTPKSEAKTLGEVAGGGLIDGLERQVSFMRSLAQDIDANLRRIEDRL